MWGRMAVPRGRGSPGPVPPGRPRRRTRMSLRAADLGLAAIAVGYAALLLWTEAGRGFPCPVPPAPVDTDRADKPPGQGQAVGRRHE